VAEAVLPAIFPTAPQIGDRTRHHIALRLLPFLFILYIINYVDRTNVGYAAIGMSRDLGFSDRVFGMGAGIFFVSYVALQMPGALLVERWSARRMISATMVAWGSLTVLTALVHTPVQLYVARFVLGAAEAGFFPGVIVYLSHWFMRKDRAKATSNFMAAIPMSFVIGSPIAGWILGHTWFAVQGWRWLFIVEGLPAIVLGIAAFFYLTDWPSEATWLASDRAMDWTRAAAREACQYRSDQATGCAQVPYRSVAGLADVSHLFCKLHLRVLVSDHVEAAVRIFGRERWNARRGTVLDSLHRNAGERMALGQEPREALALSSPGFYRGSWISGTCWSTSLNPPLTRFVHHGGYRLCLSPHLLGDPDRTPRPDGRSGRSWHD
jgi:hypothetical protein